MKQEIAAVPLDLTSPAYVEKMLRRWKYFPKWMVVIEYSDDYCPKTGSMYLDRTLGVDGLIMYPMSEVATDRFATIQQAHEAALRIRNRRPNTTLGAVPSWK